MNLSETRRSPEKISSIPISTLTFKYPRQLYSSSSSSSCLPDSSDCAYNSDIVWENLFGCLRTVQGPKELQCLSKLSHDLNSSDRLGHCNGFSATITCNRYQGNIESSEPESVVVSTKDLLYYPKTVLVIHPLLEFDLANQAGSSIRCYLPTKLTPVPQVYKVSRNLDTPEQVDVVLERECNSVKNIVSAHCESPGVFQNSLNSSEEESRTVQKCGLTEGRSTDEMSSGPPKLSTSDTFCVVANNVSFRAVHPSSPSSHTLINPDPVYSYTNLLQHSVNLIQVPTQPGRVSNPTLIITGTPQQALTTAHLGQPTVLTRTTGILRSDILIQNPADKSIKLIPVVQNPSVVLTQGQLQHSVVNFTSTLPGSVELTNPIMAASAAQIKSNQTLHGNRDSVLQMSPKNKRVPAKGGGEDDRTHDGETFRPGYVIVCHNCGTESKNFQTCDSCRRTIPRDSRIRPDRFHQTSTKSSQAQAVLDAVLGNNNKKANLTNYSIPRNNKRQAKKKVQEECIVLSSDEEGGDMAPEKRIKLDSEQDSANMSDSAAGVGPNPLSNSASAEDMSSYDSADSNASENRANYKKGLDCDREAINDLIKAKDCVTVMCRSFRVGSHKIVWKQPYNKTEFTVHICNVGVSFSMPHVRTPSKKVQVIIPKYATLNVTAHMDSRKLSYLIFSVGNKIARYIRESLGMTPDNKQSWFDPSGGEPCQRNILFMIEEFGEGSVDFIKNLYKKDLTILEHVEANAVLVKISPPSGPGKTEESSKAPTPGSSEAVGKHNSGKQELNSSKEVSKAVGKGCNQENPSNTKTVTNNSNTTESKKIVLRGHDKAVNGKLPPVKTKSDIDPNLDGDKAILKWPKKQLGITLHQSDILTLRPEQFLNDQILDFWLLYVHNKLLSDFDRDRTFVFSTFFYNRLTTKPRLKSCPSWENDKTLSAAEKRHRRVKKWTKNVDIFSKDFIVVPINESCHWYVAVICFPGLDGPHWMDDNTPIEGWQNLVVTKSNTSSKTKAEYILPPGMQPREDDKPKKKRKKATEEELPDLNDDPPVGVDNGTSSKDDEMEGNAPFPGVSSPERATSNCPTLPETTTAASTPGPGPAPTQKPVVTKTSEEPSPSKETASKVITVPQAHEFLNPDIDPFRDEAEDDPDEDNLFEEYYFTDSDDESSPASPKNETSEETPTDSDSTKEQVEEEVKTEPEDVKPKVEEPKPTGGRTDFRIKQPCILIFNSLPTFPRSRVMATLRDYLRLEYKERKGKDRPFTKFDIPGFEPNVPQQKNMCDCGIYVLQYVEQFFADPFPSFLLALPNSLRKWFPQLRTKRKEIYDTIYELVKTENLENLHLMPKFEVPPPPPKPDKAETTGAPEKPEKNGDNPASSSKSDKKENSSSSESENADKLKETGETQGQLTPTKATDTEENRNTETSPVKKSETKPENTKILLKSDNLSTGKDLLSKFNKPFQESKYPVKTTRKSSVGSVAINTQEQAVSKAITTKSAENSDSTKKAVSNSRPTILKNAKSLKVSAVQVESAPRQKITPVVPAEEPMDIDL